MGVLGWCLVFLAALACFSFVEADDTTVIKVYPSGKDSNWQGGTISAKLGSQLKLVCEVENRPQLSEQEKKDKTKKRPKLRWEFSSGAFGGNWIELSADAEVHQPALYGITEKTQDISYELQVNTVKFNSEGRYQCKIQTQTEVFVKASLLVTVTDPPSISTVLSSKQQDKTEGDTDLSIKCSATGKPPPVIEWKKLGRPDGLFRRGITFNVSSLVFDKVQASDRGTYRCTAKNVAGTKSWDVKLGVQFPPKIKPENDKAVITQALGYRAYLVCVVESNPYPTSMTWETTEGEITLTEGDAGASEKNAKFSQIIKKGDHGVDMKLVINRVTEKDFREYTCRARNALGTSSRKVELQKSDFPQETRAGEANSSTRLYISTCMIIVSLLSVLL